MDDDRSRCTHDRCCCNMLRCHSFVTFCMLPLFLWKPVGVRPFCVTGPPSPAHVSSEFPDSGLFVLFRLKAVARRPRLRLCYRPLLIF